MPLRMGFISRRQIALERKVQMNFMAVAFICAPTGELLAQAGRDTTEVIVATLDGGLLEHWRNLFPLLQQRKPHTYSRLLDAVDVKHLKG